jgi:hypothetical protein
MNKFLAVLFVVQITLIGFVVWRDVERNVQYTDFNVKSQQTGSKVLKQGFDKRVQAGVPAWALYSQSFDGLVVEVR